jgi:hypothetical protein
MTALRKHSYQAHYNVSYNTFVWFTRPDGGYDLSENYHTRKFLLTLVTVLEYLLQHLTLYHINLSYIVIFNKVLILWQVEMHLEWLFADASRGELQQGWAIRHL